MWAIVKCMAFTLREVRSLWKTFAMLKSAMSLLHICDAYYILQ